jgi:hypothetical protein
MNFTKQGDADHLPGFVVKRAGEAGEGPKLDYEELRSGILRFTSEWRRKAEDKSKRDSSSQFRGQSRETSLARNDNLKEAEMAR